MLSGTQYVAIDLVNAFFLIPTRKENEKQSAFTWNGQQYPFTIWPHREEWDYMPNEHQDWANIRQSDLDRLDVSKCVTLVHGTDDIVLIRPDE